MTDAYFWMFVAVLGWLLFAMQTWNKAITKDEVVATYERLSNEIEKEVIRMAEDLAKDPHNLFLLKTGYQHIVFSPDGARKRMKDVVNRLVTNRMTASEMAEISEDVGKILNDLLDGGSYTVRCEDLVPYKKDGIGIEIDACIDWHKIYVVFQCWPEKCKHHGRQ